MSKQVTFGGKKYDYVKPYYLVEVNSLKLIKATVKGSTLIWNISGKEFSYNQLKKCIQK